MAELSQEERLLKLEQLLMESYKNLEKNAQDLDKIAKVIKSTKENLENKTKLHGLYRKEFALAIENKKYQEDVKLYAELVIKLEPHHFKAHHSLKTLKDLNRLLLTE